MGKKFTILNYSLLLALIFSVFFPSVHALEHIADAFTKKECVHQYGDGVAEISHQHGGSHECTICDFTISSFLSIESPNFPQFFSETYIPYFFYATDNRNSLSYATPQLRGPPAI